MASNRVEDDAGLTSTETALRFRVIAGKAAVSCAKRELSTLNKTINELAHTLSSRIAGDCCSSEKHKPYIYGLLTGKPVPIIQAFSDEREPDYCKPLDISDLWQRSIRDDWIIGVDVTNCSEIYLSDLQLLVTIPFRSFQHRSKLFLLDERFRADFMSSTLPPPPKRLLLEGPVAVGGLGPGQSGILTLALDIEEIGHHPELRLNLAVAFKRKCQGHILTDCSIACTPVTITAASMVNRQTLNLDIQSNGTDAIHILAALNAYNNAVVPVQLVSRTREVYNIQEQLQDLAEMTFHPYLGILYWTQMQSLQNAWIVVDHLTEKFTIHARDRSQLIEVVQYLHGKLPADISVLPVNSTTMHGLLPNLREEVQLVSDFLENAAGTSTAAKGSVDLEGYRRFRRILFQTEQKTDSAMAIEWANSLRSYDFHESGSK